MDPLSIIASTIAVATPLVIGIRRFRDNQHAKVELSLLADEVEELVLLLNGVQHTLSMQGHQVTSDNDTHILQVLMATKVKICDLSCKMSKWTTGCMSIDGQKPRLQVWLKIGAKVRSFKSSLERLRYQILAVLSILNINRTTRVEWNLQDIARLSETVLRNQQTISGELSAIASCQGAVLHTAATSSLASGNLSSGSTVVESNDTGVHTGGMDLRLWLLWGSELLSSQGALVHPGVAVPAMTNIDFVRRKFWRTLWADSASALQVSQYFLLHATKIPAMMVCFWMTSTPLAGPVASLKVQRTISGASDIFTFAQLGDVEGIKSLFKRGLASPHDVSFSSGITPLHMAINHQHIAVCKLLLQANADPFMADFTYCTAADSAWTKMLSGCLEFSEERAMKDMFSETDCIERRNFTILHKIVLGLLEFDLEQQLKFSTATINYQDSIGRTALSIAAERGNIRHVQLLLDHRANPDIASYSDQSPLHYAASAKKADCIQIFLKAGAQVDCLTNWAQTPLHLAAAYARTAAHAEALLQAGADINKRDRDGMTPLSWTAISNNIEIATVLLGRGDIDIYNLDLRDLSAVSRCILSNRHAILEILVYHRPKLKKCFGKDESVLDVIAASADTTTMKILQGFDLSDIATCSTDILSSTSYRIVLERSDTTTDLQDAFEQLIRHAANFDDGIDSESDEAELWTDAQDVFVQVREVCTE